MWNDAVLCEINCQRVTQFWTNLSEEEEEDKEENILMTFCFGTFMSLGVLFIIKTVKDEWYIVIEAYKFTVFEILFVLSYIV